MSVRKAPSPKLSSISSCCASTVTQMIMVPCETLKVQLQIFQKLKAKGESPLLNSFRCIYRNEGIFGFWRGYFVSLSCSIPSCAIYYFAFESFRNIAYKKCEKYPKFTAFVPAVTSSAAQIITCLTTSPIDRFRTQYWANRNVGVRDLLRTEQKQIAKEGIKSIYSGLKPLLIRDILFSSMYWSIYEKVRSYTHSHGVIPIFQNLLAGTTGGMLASAVITPIDLVKTRQQVYSTQEGIWRLLKHIAKTEGIKGLYRGLTPRIIQVMPTMSIMMIVYDGLNRFILNH